VSRTDASAARPYVAVVGPGSDVPGEVLAAAAEVGRLLARAGAVVLTGGLGGVMAAAADGASEAGGTTVALLPGDDRAAAGHPHTIALATGLGEARNALLVHSADAVVCVGGSWGTLSEVALAMRTGRPVVLLHGWQVRDADGADAGLVRTQSPADAVRLVLSRLDAARRPATI
jgi:uncharacterized protein (TIGR00725 family)